MNTEQPGQFNYRGRFAPSPTGYLHFGSLVAAVGSYLDAKSNNGQWLIRIEDIDRPRAVPGASEAIISTLEKLGFEWDGEIIYQSQRDRIYRGALDYLINEKLVYSCNCSRKEIADSSITGPDGVIYPGTCRGKPITSISVPVAAIRIQTHDHPIGFKDSVYGYIEQKIQSDIGDFVLRRSDGIFSYQLAVVVDDALQNITHVIRGADLLRSTPRQIYLQQLLGYPAPQYLHLPVVVNAAGEKLSKQTNAATVDVQHAELQLFEALKFLGQNPPEAIKGTDLASLWQWAISHWQASAIPRTRFQPQS